MPASPTQLAVQPSGHPLAAAPIMITALIATSALVTSNMHNRDEYVLLILTSLAGFSLIITILAKIVSHVRHVRTQRVRERYLKTLRQAGRKDQQFAAKVKAWEQWQTPSPRPHLKQQLEI